MVKKEVGISLKESPTQLKNMLIGMNDESFLLGFNCEEGGTPEKAFVIAATQLPEVISALFEIGITYEKETGIDIGFGMVNNDEN